MPRAGTASTLAPSGCEPPDAPDWQKSLSSSATRRRDPYAQFAENQKRHGLTPLDQFACLLNLFARKTETGSWVRPQAQGVAPAIDAVVEAPTVRIAVDEEA